MSPSRYGVCSHPSLQNHPFPLRRQLAEKLLESCYVPPPSDVAVAATWPLGYPSCYCRRGTAVGSLERTAGRCQPCGKRKTGQGGSGLDYYFLFLPFLACRLSNPRWSEYVHVQDCYIVFAKYVSVSLASVMPPLCCLEPLMRCSDVGWMLCIVYQDFDVLSWDVSSCWLTTSRHRLSAWISLQWNL